MIVAIVVSFIVPSGYHIALIYVSIATMFFLVNFQWLERLLWVLLTIKKKIP